MLATFRQNSRDSSLMKKRTSIQKSLSNLNELIENKLQEQKHCVLEGWSRRAAYLAN